MLLLKRSWTDDDLFHHKRFKAPVLSPSVCPQPDFVPRLQLPERKQMDDLHKTFKRSLEITPKPVKPKKVKTKRKKKKVDQEIKFYSQSQVDMLLAAERKICQDKINELMAYHQQTIDELTLPISKDLSYLS